MPRKRPGELRGELRAKPAARKRPPVPLESQEQAAITRLLDAAGFCVYDLSQGRATRQTPGLPDLYAVHPEVGWVWWVEVKRQKGARVSVAQRLFQDIHVVAPREVRIKVGSFEEAWVALEEVGFAYREGGEWRLRPHRGPMWLEWHRVQAEIKAESRRKRGRKAIRDAQRNAQGGES